jgi:DNA repair protein RadC
LKDESSFWEDLKSGKFVSMVKESSRGKMINSSETVYHIMKPVFSESDDVEMFYCIFMDTKNRIITIEKMFSGTISNTAVYPREIIKRIIELKASAVIAVHNHPSGDQFPSGEDKLVTLQLWVALKSIDVKLHDHIIIGNGYYSMVEDGFMVPIQDRFNSFLRSSF